MDYSNEELQALLDQFKASQLAEEERAIASHVTSQGEKAAANKLGTLATGNNADKLLKMKEALPQFRKDAVESLVSRMSLPGTASTAEEAASVLSKGVNPAKFASDSANVFAQSGLTPTEFSINQNELDNLVRDPAKSRRIANMAAEAAAKVPSSLESLAGMASDKLAPITNKIAPYAEAAATKLAPIAQKLAPAARIASKVAGPMGTALAAYDAIKPTETAANADIPQGPQLTAADLMAMEAEKADTDLVPPSAPQFAEDPNLGPNGPSLFDRVSAKMQEKELDGSIGVEPETKLATKSSVSGKVKSSSNVREPAANAKPVAPVAEEQGYQLGTLDNLKAAQQKQNIMNLIGGLSETGNQFLDNTKQIGDMFIDNPNKVQYANKTGENLRSQGKNIVDQHNAQVDNQKNDPKSQSSIEMRKLMKQMGFDFGNNVSSADLEKKFPALSNIYNAREAEKARAALARESAAARKEELAYRTTKDSAERKELESVREVEQLDKLEGAFGKDLLRQENAGSRSALGKNILIRDSADRISQLSAQVKGDLNKLNVQQAYEIARSLDNMLSQGAATNSATDHLMVKSGVSQLSALKQYASNEPVPAELGAFLANQMETVNRERALADHKVSQYRQKVLALADPRLTKSRKIELEAKIDALAKAEVQNPEEITRRVEALEGQYKETPKELQSIDGQPSVNAIPHPEDGPAVEWAKATLKSNPSDPKIIQKAQMILKANGAN